MHRVIIIIILFSFWIMIIAAYYLLLLFYEITKLYDYWLVNLCSFVKWTHSLDFSLTVWHIQWLFRFLLNIDAQFSLLFIENYNFHIFSNPCIYHNNSNNPMNVIHIYHNSIPCVEIDMWNSVTCVMIY